MIEYSLSLDNGPSPNGKALDSDSSIFKVRILVGQLKINMLCWSFFVVVGKYMEELVGDKFLVYF